MQGTIKKLTDRGFGFITKDGGGGGGRGSKSNDVFFHSSGMAAGGVAFDDLQEGQRVEFEVKENDRDPERGPRAENVRVIR